MPRECRASSLSGLAVLLLLLPGPGLPHATAQSPADIPLPADAALEKLGWTRLGAPRVFQGGDLEAGLGSDAIVAILEENGCRQLRQDLYSGRSGEVRVDTLLMQDAKAAYGGFTFWTPQDAESISLGDGAALRAGQVLLWQGRLLWRLTFPEHIEALQDEARRLAGLLSEAAGQGEGTPPLALFLPAEGRMAGTDRYVLGSVGLRQVLPGATGDLLGFRDQCEVAVSDYTMGDQVARLLLVGYPNMSLARHHLGEVMQGLEAVDLQGQGYFAKRTGVLIAILVGAVPPAVARQFLDPIEYTFSVQWIYRKDGRRSASGESLSLMYTIVSSLLLTLLLSVATVGAGVALGGSRFLLRKWMPNNYLDKPERVELTRLKLYG